jgi:thioredoxin-related protein
MKKLLFTFLMLASALFASSPIHWAKDYQSGVAEATKQNKPMIFILSRHTCKYCVILERTTLSDPAIVNELNSNFIPVISYSDDGDYLPKELWQPGTPAIWFLDEMGKPMFQPIMGAVDAQNFSKALDIVKDEFIKREKLKARSQ